MNTSKTLVLHDSERVLCSVYLATRCVIGALLLTAGISKLFPVQAVMLTPSLELPAIIVGILALVEVGLGWCALQGIRSKTAYCMTVVSFVVFLGVLSVRWFGGAASCPCLASLEVPIGLMLGADAVCLVALIASRRRWLSGAPDGHLMSSLSRGLAFAIPLVLIVVGLHFGSVGSFLAWMSGQRVIAENHRSYLGKVFVGETKDVRFHVTNVSRDPVRIVGAKTSCSCTAFKDLPMDLASGASGDIRVTVTGDSKDSNRYASYAATLLCDLAGGEVTLRIDGAVVPNR